MDLQMFAKQCNISKLGRPSLEQKSVRFQKLVCQVLTIIFLWSCLGRPRHENHNSSLGLMLKLITPKGFKTWNTKSWIVQSLSRLGNMDLQNNVTFQNLACQVLDQKSDRFQNLVCQVLTIIFTCVYLCSCLGKPRHDFFFTCTVESIYPKKFKTWSTKS